MIGLALVSAVTVLASSIKKSGAEIIDESIGADYVVNAQQYLPFSTAIAERLAGRPEVAAVSPLRFGMVKLDGQTVQFEAADPATLGQVIRLRMQSGSLGDLGDGSVLLSERRAERLDAAVGGTVPAEFSAGGRQSLRVAGIYDDNPMLGDVVLHMATYDANFSRRLDTLVLVKGAPGLPPERVRAAIEDVAAAFPNVEVNDQTELKRDQQAQIDQLLGLIQALLLFSILIAVLGIMNTLALSIFERTRELGLVRAIGMNRRQVRAMVRYESVIIAVFGAVLGLAVGTLFGWALVRAFRTEGITTLVVPAGQLFGYAVVAALFGVVAAIWPARRAAKLDVLAAISYE